MPLAMIAIIAMISHLLMLRITGYAPLDNHLMHRLPAFGRLSFLKGI
jgi:hypothetical protein